MKIEIRTIILLFSITLVSCNYKQNENSFITPSIITPHSVISTLLPTLKITNAQKPTKTSEPTLTNTSTPDFAKPCYIFSKEQIDATEQWKSIKSQGGWKVKYPPSWVASSCRNCWDLTEPNIPIHIEPKDISGISIALGGGKIDNGESISAEEYFTTEINNYKNIVEINYCSVNGMPALRILSFYNTYIETIEIWNKSYRYFINIHTISQTIDKFVNDEHYSIFQLIVSTFKENI